MNWLVMEIEFNFQLFITYETEYLNSMQLDIPVFD